MMASASLTGQRALQPLPSMPNNTEQQEQRSITEYDLPENIVRDASETRSSDDKGIAVLKVAKVRGRYLRLYKFRDCILEQFDTYEQFPFCCLKIFVTMNPDETTSDGIEWDFEAATFVLF